MSDPGAMTPAESGEFIAKNAGHVAIHKEGIEKCADDIAARIASGELNLTKMFVNTELHPQTADDAGVDWVFFTDTLNFSFWNQDDDPQYLVTWRGQTHTGFLAMCAAINRTLAEGVPLTDPKYFATIGVDKLDQHLRGDDDVPCPLIASRVECLREVGKVLNDRYEGSFNKVMERAGGSALSLLNLVLKEFPCFRDEGVFQGTPVTFHKRAQILVADIWCLFEGQGRGDLVDIDKLTMFADYRVPQSLQHYGVLSYSEELREILEENTVMEPGDKFEVEIRGCSIHAVEAITARVRDRLKERNVGSVVYSILVDQFLWGYRRKHVEEMKAFPYHKVRSIFY